MERAATTRPADALWSVKQVAGYLNVNERTVLKLVTEGALPAVKVGSQWRFRKAMLDAWLDDQMLGVKPRLIERMPSSESPRILLDLARCCEPAHILPTLAAIAKTTAIEELAGLAHGLGLIRDRTWFVGALIERENAMPTATRGGIAFLHTLGRNPEQVVRPFMVLGRSQAGIDFDAPDRRPTHLFFVLGLKYQELHLPWLAKLASMLGEPGAVPALLRAPDAESLYQALLAAERALV